jgi:hypothetical protein
VHCSLPRGVVLEIFFAVRVWPVVVVVPAISLISSAGIFSFILVVRIFDVFLDIMFL